MKKKQNRKEYDEKRLEKLAEQTARRISNASDFTEFVRYLSHPWRMMWINFYAGIFRGLGFVIGATVVLAAIAFILIKILGNLPIVGDWFQQLGEFVSDLEETNKLIKNSIAGQ